MRKYTPWFDAYINRVRVGFYEVNRPGISKGFPVQSILMWHGSGWTHTVHSSNGRFPHENASMCGNDKWRGLAEKP